jgi:hypothetical protein
MAKKLSKIEIKHSHYFACKHGCNITFSFNYLLSPIGGPTAFKIWLRKDWNRKNSVQKFSKRRSDIILDWLNIHIAEYYGSYTKGT